MRCWKTWIKAAGVRAIKTVAQTAVATIGTTAVLSEADWLMVASASALSGVRPFPPVLPFAGLPECKEADAQKEGE